jgi:quercetin dioxygenase-like cupin family protein
MANLVELAEITPIQVWDGVVARRVQGDRITLAIVELAPNAIVPEHRHANEQCGLVIEGEVRFRIADEERAFGPGGTWRILGDIAHELHTGPEGAVVVDVFTPIRGDWDDRPTVGMADEPAELAWPRAR